MSDSVGNLLFYSDGEVIMNKNAELMKNGDSLNYGLTSNSFSPTLWTLPWPGVANKYALLYFNTSYYIDSQTGVQYNWSTFSDMQYSTVEFSDSDTLGRVVEKNIVYLPNGPFDKHSACKHANGRDWWIITLDVFKRGYYTVLFDSSGFHPQGYYELDLDLSIPLPSTWNTPQLANHESFSPDGKKFTFSVPDTAYYVFDFDRCTGRLSTNYLRLETPHYNWPSISVFSPNNRYVYAMGSEINLGKVYNNIYQFDLWSSNVQGSMLTIDTIRSSFNNIGANVSSDVFVPALDGRFYGRSGANFLHAIEFPNRHGRAAKITERYYQFENDTALLQVKIYNPNYRLGPIDGSSCDTLGLDNHPLAHFRYGVEDTLRPAQLTFTDLSAYEPATWSWDFGDPASGAANMSSDTSPVHIFSAPGVYQVCQTVCNVNSCDTECKEVVIGTSTVDGGRVMEEGDLEVYPNPTSDILNVAYDIHNEESAELAIFNPLGQQVQQISLGTTTRNYQLDISDFAPGMYWMQVKQNGISTSKPFVVIK